jgi:hypothetical protein
MLHYIIFMERCIFKKSHKQSFSNNFNFSWNFENNNMLATIYNCIFVTYYFVCFALLNVDCVSYYMWELCRTMIILFKFCWSTIILGISKFERKNKFYSFVLKLSKSKYVVAITRVCGHQRSWIKFLKKTFKSIIN